MTRCTSRRRSDNPFRHVRRRKPPGHPGPRRPSRRVPQLPWHSTGKDLRDSCLEVAVIGDAVAVRNNTDDFGRGAGPRPQRPGASSYGASRQASLTVSCPTRRTSPAWLIRPGLLQGSASRQPRPGAWSRRPTRDSSQQLSLTKIRCSVVAPSLLEHRPASGCTAAALLCPRPDAPTGRAPNSANSSGWRIRFSGNRHDR